jgi:LacI family transcriptional regulator
MREVAAVANVSLKTVSRVVNSEPCVSPDLARRVNEAINLLGYRANAAAVSLRRLDQRTQTIGAVVDDMSDPYSSAMLRAIEDVARSHDTLLLAGSTNSDPHRAREYLRAFVSHRVDGVIAIPVGDDPTSILRERRFGRPIVLIDRLGPLAGADTASADDRGGARLAIGHLITHGHRRIGFLGNLLRGSASSERHLGYLEALGVEGVRLDPRLVLIDVRDTDAATEAVHNLLDGERPPTALFTANSTLTVGAVRALQQRASEDAVALVGFDDIPHADLFRPAVSMVARDPTGLGHAAAMMLFSRLAGDDSPPRHISIPTHLIIRGWRK